MMFLSLQMAIYSVEQPRIAGGNGRGDDGAVYGHMADYFSIEARPDAVAPFVYRVGVPWLAATVSRLSDSPIDESFRLIDIAADYILILLIYVLALKFCQPMFAALTCVLYMLPYYGYVRLTFFYPVMVDTPWMVLIILSLIIMTQKTMSLVSVTILAMVTFAATLMRETGLLIPLTFALSLPPVRRLMQFERILGHGPVPISGNHEHSWSRLFLSALVLFAAAMLAIYLSRNMTTATGDYSFFTAAFDSVRGNNPWHLALSAFLAFGGPMISLLIIEPRVVLNHLRDTPSHFVFVLLVITVSYVGGVDTVRFLSWASPVVLMLICMGLQTVVVEIPRLKTFSRKLVVSATLLGIVAFQISALHPFEGYFADYTAFIKWGGLQITGADPFSVLLFAAMTLSAVIIWRWFGADERPDLGLQNES